MLGERLKLARAKAGLSLRDLAGMVDPPVSAQAISRYEKNEMMPSSRVLLGLGKALGVSLDFLMSGEVAQLEGVEFRKASGTTARDRARLEALVLEKLEAYLAVEDILELHDRGDPFGPVAREAIGSLEEAEEAAEALREHWQLGTDPVPSVTGLLEDHGFKVIEEDLPPRFDGVTAVVKRSSGRPDTDVIMVSSQVTVERKRFNLAHELGHRVVRSVAPDVPGEKAMHRFAGAFLVPAAHLRAEVGARRQRITYEEIMRLKRFYGVSAAALLFRFKDARIVPPEAVDNAFRTFARSWRQSEPEPIKHEFGVGAFENPQRFERLVYRALGEQLISPVRAAQLLGKPLSVVEAGLKGPKQP